MIIYTFTSPTYVGGVGPGTNELLLGPGQFELGGATYVQVSTNAKTDVTWIQDGCYVAVDSAGQIGVTGGPRLGQAGLLGFTTAIGAIGFLLFLRWFARSFVSRPSNISLPD